MARWTGDRGVVTETVFVASKRRLRRKKAVEVDKVRVGVALMSWTFSGVSTGGPSIARNASCFQVLQRSVRVLKCNPTETTQGSFVVALVDH